MKQKDRENKLYDLTNDLVQEIIYGGDRFDRADFLQVLVGIIDANDKEIAGLRDMVLEGVGKTHPESVAFAGESLDYWLSPDAVDFFRKYCHEYDVDSALKWPEDHEAASRIELEPWLVDGMYDYAANSLTRLFDVVPDNSPLFSAFTRTVDVQSSLNTSQTKAVLEHMHKLWMRDMVVKKGFIYGPEENLDAGKAQLTSPWLVPFEDLPGTRRLEYVNALNGTLVNCIKQGCVFLPKGTKEVAKVVAEMNMNAGGPRRTVGSYDIREIGPAGIVKAEISLYYLNGKGTTRRAVLSGPDGTVGSRIDLYDTKTGRKVEATYSLENGRMEDKRSLVAKVVNGKKI